MPTRTIVQDLCDICFVEQDGRETLATDKLRFGWQGRDFLLLVCELHVGPIREELQRLSELATSEDRQVRSTRATGDLRAMPGSAPQTQTLFSQLSEDEKLRFRIWADMPNARRIGDARVQEWTEAGKP